MASGYCDCACRDCFDVAITSGGPALCGDCTDAGCDVDGEHECVREDAYDADAELQSLLHDPDPTDD